MLLLIAFLFALAFAVLTYAGMKIFSNSAVAYRQQFTNQARVGLADLFIFIEPEKLFVMNLAALAAALFLTLLLTNNWLITLAVVVVAGASPRFLYGMLKRRRLAKLLEQLPDSLVSLSGSLKAGASLLQALELTVQEESPPIAQELDLLLRELRVGVPFDRALDNFAARAPAQEVMLVVAGMKISREIGGNLSEVLERLASTIRRKLEMEGKIRALTSQGKLQGLVMTALPLFLGLVLYHMEPTHMSRLFSEPLGWAAVLLILVGVSIGYFFIRKIVNIDV